MIKRDRFKILRSSTFWLSQEEDEPGSKSWDSSLPRIVNVVRLKDKLATRNELVFNTHFDHKGKIARRSAKIIKARVGQLGNDERVIICGDFNSPEGSKPYNTLVDTGGMIDTFRIAKPNRTKEESTLTGWNGRLVGNRIDWVLCSTNFHVLCVNRSHSFGWRPIRSLSSDRSFKILVRIQKMRKGIFIKINLLFPLSCFLASLLVYADKLPNDVRWVRESREYETICTQIFNRAKLSIEVQTGLLKVSKTNDKNKQLAVVVDLDETILDNSTYQVERWKMGLGFTQESWSDWVNRKKLFLLSGQRTLILSGIKKYKLYS